MTDADLLPLVEALDPDDRVRHQMKALDLPAMVDLEVSSACDRCCRMCPREAIHRGPGIIPPRLVDVLDDWLPDDARVMLCGLGEPLLHPNLPAVAERLRGSHRILGVTTHGERLSPSVADALIEAGVGLLQVSVHGADATSARAVAPSADLAVTLRNLEHLSRLASAQVQVNVTATFEPGVQGHRPAIEALCRDLGIGFFPRFLHHRGGALAGGPEATAARRGLGCGIFARCTFVTWEGDVLACCNDLSGATRLGNIEDTSYSAILEKKAKIIERRRFFPSCAACDDTYRHLLLLEPGLLEGVPE